jgi:hypothetical protein
MKIDPDVRRIRLKEASPFRVAVNNQIAPLRRASNVQILPRSPIERDENICFSEASDHSNRRFGVAAANVPHAIGFRFKSRHICSIVFFPWVPTDGDHLSLNKHFQVSAQAFSAPFFRAIVPRTGKERGNSRGIKHSPFNRIASQSGLQPVETAIGYPMRDQIAY